LKVSLSPKHKKRKRVTLFILLFLVIILLALLVWEFSPFPLFFDFISNEKSQSAPPQASDSASYFPDKTPNPSIMEVSPQDLYKAFLQQYRLRPDLRFIKAFEILANRFGEYQRIQPRLSPYKMGEILSNGKEILIPLLKDDQIIQKIKIPLPMAFSELMSALNQWLEAMEKSVSKSETPPLQEESLQELEIADQEINQVDPRAIIFGLKKLEDLRSKVGLEPKIFRSAARAYALLLLVLSPDPMDYTDTLAAEALSYLALARRLDPRLPGTREEALIAMTMGYTAHAAALMQTDAPGSNDPDTKKFEAYLRKDVNGLRNLEGKGTKALGLYLLIRLYRDMRLEDEAGQGANKFFEEFPFFYPALVEVLFSGGLESAKALAALYPLDILTHLEQGFTSESIKNETAWKERIKNFSGESMPGPLSLTQFENLLNKWSPLSKEGGQGSLIDDSRVKTIFRTLYSGALFLRFNLYHNRWASPDLTQNYVGGLAAKDKDHPLIIRMQAMVLAKTGKNREVDAHCTKLLNQNDVPGTLAKYAYSNLFDPLTRISLARLIAQKLDGRPENLLFLGLVFQRLRSLDLAEQYYTFGLSQDPYQSLTYTYLARVTGRDDSLSLALTKYPYHFSLLEEAGNYFAQKDDLSSKEKALKYFDMALKLFSAKTSLYQGKIQVLRLLNRQEEAISLLKVWLKEFGKEDLTTTMFKTLLAKTYLEMKKPKLALETVSKGLVAYQAEALMVAARAHEELGQFKLAEGIYRRAAGRFPTLDQVLAETAAFYWRMGRDREAAALITLGRKNQGHFSQWYFKEFVGVFSQGTVERIKKAVSSISKDGGTTWEVTNLAIQFERLKRPEVAYMLLQEFQPTAFGGRLEHFVNIYKVLKNWKGESEAFKYLQSVVSAQMKMPLTMILSKNGLFDLILTELNDPGSYPSTQKEFLWLQRLIAWLAMGKKPADIETQLIDHYKEKWLERLSGTKTSDHYHTIGQYLLGTISRQKLLSLIQVPKQRCLFSYYIGLSERLKSHFPEATNWYHLCQETLFQNTEEIQKAGEELFWWAQLGVKNRNRLIGDDRDLSARLEMRRAVDLSPGYYSATP
jgi:hypothetical protein